MRNSSVIGRMAAIAAVLIAVVAVAIIVLSGGSRATRSRRSSRTPARSSAAIWSRCRATAIGTVSDIALTPNGQAKLTLDITDSTTARCGRARWRRSARSRCRASPTATSICARRRPAAGDPDGGTIGDAVHDQRGRPRPALQHARRPDPQGPPGRDPGLGRRSTRARARGPEGVAIPQPGDRLDEHAVPRDQPRHRQVHRTSSSRPATWSPTSPSAQADLSGLVQHLGTHDRGAGRPARRARPVDPAAARLHGAWPTRRSSTSARALDDLKPLVDATKPVAPKLQQPARAAASRWPRTRCRRSATCRTSSAARAPTTT